MPPMPARLQRVLQKIDGFHHQLDDIKVEIVDAWKELSESYSVAPSSTLQSGMPSMTAANKLLCSSSFDQPTFNSGDDGVNMLYVADASFLDPFGAATPAMTPESVVPPAHDEQRQDVPRQDQEKPDHLMDLLTEMGESARAALSVPAPEEKSWSEIDIELFGDETAVPAVDESDAMDDILAIASRDDDEELAKLAQPPTDDHDDHTHDEHNGDEASEPVSPSSDDELDSSAATSPFELDDVNRDGPRLINGIEQFQTTPLAGNKRKRCGEDSYLDSKRHKITHLTYSSPHTPKRSSCLRGPRIPLRILKELSPQPPRKKTKERVQEWAHWWAEFPKVHARARQGRISFEQYRQSRMKTWQALRDWRHTQPDYELSQKSDALVYQKQRSILNLLNEKVKIPPATVIGKRSRDADDVGGEERLMGYRWEPRTKTEKDEKKKRLQDMRRRAIGTCLWQYKAEQERKKIQEQERKRRRRVVAQKKPRTWTTIPFDPSARNPGAQTARWTQPRTGMDIFALAPQSS
ncbi:MAG: hypothetical protein Q9174_005974 [Haloplaca sp. 1 TL-2023]